MLVLAVTHPDTTGRSPRSLSEGGRNQALMIARRLREIIGKHIAIGTILSSPKVRCLETAIIVARELGETTKDDGGYDRVNTALELEEMPGKAPQSSAILKELLSLLSQATVGASGKAVLLSLHGDLSNMLGESVTFKPKFASGGWFDVRPVLAVCEVTSEGIQVTACEVFQGGSWITCLQ